MAARNEHLPGMLAMVNIETRMPVPAVLLMVIRILTDQRNQRESYIEHKIRNIVLNQTLVNFVGFIGRSCIYYSSSDLCFV